MTTVQGVVQLKRKTKNSESNKAKEEADALIADADGKFIFL